MTNKRLKNKNGDIINPITHESAVLDDNGVNIGEKLNNMETMVSDVEANLEELYAKDEELSSQLNSIDSTNKLNNKSIVAIGDSIMRGGGNNNVGFVDLIGLDNNMIINNISYSGSTMATGVEGRKSICDMIDDNTLLNPDFILINGGINDYYNQVPIGEVKEVKGNLSGSEHGYTNFDTTTFCGALEELFRKLYTNENYQESKIIFIIPHKIVNSYYDREDGQYNYSSLREKTIEICEKWSIEYVDLFNKSRLITSVPFMDYRKYCGNTDENDGVHPNEEGYRKFYIPHIIAKIKEMI